MLLTHQLILFIFIVIMTANFDATLLKCCSAKELLPLEMSAYGVGSQNYIVIDHIASPLQTLSSVVPYK